MSRTLDSRRHDSGGNNGRFEQAQVIFSEIKNLPQTFDPGRCPQVHGPQSDHRLIDDSHLNLDRWSRLILPTVGPKVYRDIENLCAFWIIHPQKKDIRPPCVGQVHPDGGSLAEYLPGAIGLSLQKLLRNDQRMIRGMTHSKHPLVTFDLLYRPAHLSAQSMKSQFMIPVGKGG